MIMEVDERFLTLLTPEGEFLKAHKQKQDYVIGQEIQFSPVSEYSKRKSLFFHTFPGKALTAAIFAIMIGVVSFIPFSGSNDVYAYMSIDVNPSIELAVNDELEVVDIEAYNSEGQHIISKLENWKKLDVTTVTTYIIEEIKKQGFFQNHNKVLITTVYDDKHKTQVDQELQSNIEEIESKIEKDNLELKVVEGTKEERKAAHKQGITTGIYKEKQPNKQINTTEEKKLKDNRNHNNNEKDLEEPIVSNETKNKKNQVPGQLKKEENKIKDKADTSEKEKKENKKNIDQKNVRKQQNKGDNDRSEDRDDDDDRDHYGDERDNNRNQKNKEDNKDKRERQKNKNNKKDDDKNAKWDED